MASKRHRKRRLGNGLFELRNGDPSPSRVETATPAKPAWPPSGIASDASATDYLSFGTEIRRQAELRRPRRQSRHGLQAASQATPRQRTVRASERKSVAGPC